tara:strand:+ start:125 stop:517 length:393 start_codon:yes stop_codon:yes gene_type:complete
VGHKYRNKYITIKDIYKTVKSALYKNITYKTYYSIIKKFFEILVRDAAERDHKVYLPNYMGYVYVDERPHVRAFHVRVDNEATKKAGKIVKYRIPILDDYYKKLIWVRPSKYKNCKIMPLQYTKEIINKN